MGRCLKGSRLVDSCPLQAIGGETSRRKVTTMTDQKTLFGWPSGGSLRLCLLAGLALMAGCGGSGKPGSAGKGAAAGSLPLVGVSLLTLDNPFFRVIGDTLTTELAKEGFQVLVVSADKDPARQSNQVQDF